jgi:transcriptional regulator with XRE-family HTH domain
MKQAGTNPGLGQKVQELREARGWSQGKLSQLTGLSRSYVSTLEADKVKKPSAETMQVLATAFKVDPNELYQAAGYQPENHATRMLASAKLRFYMAQLSDLQLETQERIARLIGPIIEEVQREERERRAARKTTEK